MKVLPFEQYGHKTALLATGNLATVSHDKEEDLEKSTSRSFVNKFREIAFSIRRKKRCTMHDQIVININIQLHYECFM